MGDPAGIGPEICVKALSDPSILETCAPILIGDRELLELTVEQLGSSVRFQTPDAGVRSSITVVAPNDVDGPCGLRATVPVAASSA